VLVCDEEDLHIFGAIQHDHLSTEPRRASEADQGLRLLQHRDLGVAHRTFARTPLGQVGSEERPPWATAACVSRKKAIR